jgi:hypothetical protein
MPLIGYFGFVGSALLLVLIGMGWCLPPPAIDTPDSATTRSAIRIASAEKLPERVIIDSSLPTIAASPRSLEFSERWPKGAVTPVAPVSNPAMPAPVSEAARKPKPQPEKPQPAKPQPARQPPAKQVAAVRPVPKVTVETAGNDREQTSRAASGLPLLDSLKQGMEQTQARLMASLAPLTSLVSKPDPR